MKLIITSTHVARAGRFLDRQNGPLALALKQVLPLRNLDVNQNHVSGIDKCGHEVRYKVQPAFTPGKYKELVEGKTTHITCNLKKVAPINPSDHDIE